jgi:hypothetical protein
LTASQSIRMMKEEACGQSILPASKPDGALPREPHLAG